MQFVTYLTFNGNCREAFAFYEQVLAGKILMMQSHGESPMADTTPPEWRDRIMHARLDVDGAILMGADAPPQFYTTPGGFSVSIQIEDAGKGERIFNTLAEGGQVRMPFQKTFWADGFGMLIDRFGTPWMVNAGMAA